MAADRPASFAIHRHLSSSGLPDWLGAVARKYEHKISFIVKINHKELLTYRAALDAAVDAAREAGELLRADFHRPGGPRGSGDHAEVDEQAEQVTREKILAAFPAAYHGEETGSASGGDMEHVRLGSLPSCRPLPKSGTSHSRPIEFWPVDALRLAENLLVLGSQAHGVRGENRGP